MPDFIWLIMAILATLPIGTRLSLHTPSVRRSYGTRKPPILRQFSWRAWFPRRSRRWALY